MRRTSYDILFSILLGIVVPAVCLHVLSKLPPKENQQIIAFTDPSQQTTTGASEQINDSVSVLLSDGSVKPMEMEEYLLCVLLAEMPAQFETEAIKAQAVVARTYTYKRMSSPGKHEQAAVCTDPGCCQAFCDTNTYLSGGGTQASVDKMRSCAEETKAQVLTYEGQLIEATYFSCSGGRTEAALAVWGSDIPYLQAVDSPGEEDAAHYIDTVSFHADDFSARLGLQLQGQPGSWLGNVTYTDGGGVKTIQIGQTVFDGVTVRQRLGLRSTAFVMTAVGQTVTVTTKGFGHRVGMSQYGAEAMAVQGADYAQILAHYYAGTSLQTWQHN